MRTCKECKTKYERRSPSQLVCSYKCAKAYRKVLARKWKYKKKVMKSNIKTKSDWIKELQVLVNKFVRIRDKDKNCISCNKPFKGKFDAGHFLSTGAYPNLRFHLDNIHGQCVHCNRDKHGNQIEYAINLRLRIGEERYYILMGSRNISLKISIPEIEELKNFYKAKIKTL